MLEKQKGETRSSATPFNHFMALLSGPNRVFMKSIGEHFKKP